MLPLPKFLTLPVILSNLFPPSTPGKASDLPEKWIINAFYGVIAWSCLGAPNWHKLSAPNITLPTLPSPTPAATFVTATTTTPLKPAAAPLKTATTGIPVTCPNTIQVVNLRQSANLSAILTTVPCGDRVTLLGRDRISANNEIWVPVEYKGSRGWMTARYLAL